MIIDKTEFLKNFGGKENKSMSGFNMNMGFYFAVQRMMFNLSSNKQSKFLSPKFFGTCL